MYGVLCVIDCIIYPNSNINLDISVFGIDMRVLSFAILCLKKVILYGRIYKSF